MITAVSTADAVSMAIDAIEAIMPSRPGDSLNAPLVRRIEVLLRAAMALADALPDNGGLRLSESEDLTVLGYAAADLISRVSHRQSHVAQRLPAGFTLPRFSEAAAETCGS
jgi:hypothetical protein